MATPRSQHQPFKNDDDEFGLNHQILIDLCPNIQANKVFRAPTLEQSSMWNSIVSQLGRVCGFLPSSASHKSNKDPLMTTITTFVDQQLGQDCYHIHELEVDKPFPQFIDRDASMKQIFQGAQMQLGRLQSRAPLYAVTGAPGAGKTRLLLQLQKKAELFANAKRYIQDKSTALLFHPNNVLVINITFNSIMPVDVREIGLTFEQMVAARVLFQYFGSTLIGQDVKFRDFLKHIKQCPDFGDISIDKCLKEILRHFESTFPAGRTGRGICMLGIDEIIKSCPDDFLALAQSISAVGSWSDQPIKINEQRNFVLIPVITSLSQVLVRSSAQTSGRHIQWIPLPPLEGLSKQVCDMLNVTTQRAKDLIELLCRYLGYHGRLIEIAVEILEDEVEYLEQGPSALVEIISNLKQNSSCRAYLGLEGKVDEIGIVATVLRGDSLKPDARPIGSARTVDELLINGVYIDIVPDDDFVVPRMSLFQMYVWATKLAKADADCDFARALRGLLRPVERYGPEFLEKFHTGFEYCCRATEAYSVDPNKLHLRHQQESFYVAESMRSLTLAPGRVELQELASVVDLGTLSNYRQGVEEPAHRDTTHVDFQFGSFAREHATAPTRDITSSFVDRGDLVAIVSLSAPRQPLFDGVVDSLCVNRAGQRVAVRCMNEQKLKCEVEGDLNWWYTNRVQPFIAGVPLAERSKYFFLFVSTGDIGARIRELISTSCRDLKIQLTVFEENTLHLLYGPTLIYYPGFESLGYLKRDLKEAKASKKVTAALSSSASRHDQPMTAAAVAPSVSGPSTRVVASSRALLSGGGKQEASAPVSVQRARSSGRATVVHSDTSAAVAAPVPDSKKRAAAESTSSRSVELRASKRLKQ